MYELPNQAEADKYWMARKAGFAAGFRESKNSFCGRRTVLRGQIPTLINKCKELAKKYNVEIVVLGHAGDGNLHPAILTGYQQ